MDNMKSTITERGDYWHPDPEKDKKLGGPGANQRAREDRAAASKPKSDPKKLRKGESYMDYAKRHGYKKPAPKKKSLLSKLLRKEAYRVLAKDKGEEGKPSQFSYKDEKDANKFADSIKKKGGKATVTKEHHQKDKDGKVIEHGDGTPSSVEEAKVDTVKYGTMSSAGKEKARNERKFGKVGWNQAGQSQLRKGAHWAKRGEKKVRGAKVEEDFIGEVIDKTVNSNTKKIDVMKGKNKVKINPNVGEQVENGGDESINANVVDPALGRKERRIAMMKRQILRKKQQAVMQGAGSDITASHDPLSIRDTISSILELNRYEKETGKSSGSINMPKGKPTQKGGTSSPVMRAVRSKIRQETGKPHGQHKKNKGEKDRRQPGDRKTTPADTIAKRRQSKADAEKLMRDTSGT